MSGQSMMDRTLNFLRLYVYSQGQSEVPTSYHMWCGISLIAACTGNNIWFEKTVGLKDDKLFPNLYVMLIGDSAVGKGKAISRALSYLEDHEITGVYRGKITSAYMHTLLGNPRKVNGNLIRDSRMYLVTPEMAYSVGQGPLADDFVKFMTEIFTGDTGLHKEGTRTNKLHIIKNPVVNWLAGTTKEWLLDCVTPGAISSGFFARVVGVKETYNTAVRHYRPSVPSDYERVREHLRARVLWYCNIVGQFRTTPQADIIDREWYEKRPPPPDERLLPVWKREHDIVLKLAMVFALADLVPWYYKDVGVPLVIQAEHMMQAQDAIRTARNNIMDIINFSAVSKDTQYLQLIADSIKNSQKIQHSVLLRRLSNRGVSRDVLAKQVATLTSTGQIRVESHGKGTWYVWNSPTVGGLTQPEVET